MGSGQQSAGGGAPQNLSATLLAQPLGQWLLGLIGVIALGGGLGQIFLAVSGGFQKDFKAWEMSADEMRWASWVARFGLVARGIIFGLGGLFLIQAARTATPSRPRGSTARCKRWRISPLGRGCSASSRWAWSPSASIRSFAPAGSAFGKASSRQPSSRAAGDGPRIDAPLCPPCPARSSNRGGAPAAVLALSPRVRPPPKRRRNPRGGATKRR